MTHRIAYFIHHDISRNDGVTKKIKGQIDYWRKLGLEVKCFCVLPKIGDSILPCNKYEANHYLKQRLTLNTELIDDIDEFNPDIIYFRYDTWSRNYSVLSKKYKVVCELNTLDVEEFNLLFKKDKTLKSLLRYMSYKYLRHFVLKRVSGIVAVTNEIKNHKSNDGYTNKRITIPNAINLDEFPIIKKISSDGSRIGLFFMGTPNQPWHGIDIIEDMAAHMPEYDFHIVGVTEQSYSNVFYHGYLQQEEYLKVLSKCQICIGSLALFRNNMEEACPLKVREYLAYGYPIILGYHDTAFLEHVRFSWLHYIDKNIDYSSLISFINNNANVTVPRSDLNSITVEFNEGKRIEFIKK